ncbi:MAG: ATP-binding protein, partial [Spirochaetales bacterium]|nr:ATP-binding protein [Spirochaetales bacterium]
YLYGNSPNHIEEDVFDFMPFFDRDSRTIVITRDFLNPFMPQTKDKALFDEISNRSYTNALEEAEETKQEMVRYFFLGIKDDYMFSLLVLFRSLQIIFTLVILFIVLLIGRLFLWNIKYRNQIEEQERLVLLGAAARTLTHEIKNPLSSIRLQSTIIKRSGCGLHEESLRILNEEVERLSLLTERISDFLRHPEGNPDPNDLSDLIMNCLSRYSDRIPGIENTVISSMMIRIDPDRFRSILDNLLNNAIESESSPSEIGVTLERRGHEAHLTVSDRGKGIGDDQLEELFNPYYTTKSRGTGIGLSIVLSFVKAAGGDIHIDSEPGKGTDVMLTFPLWRHEA